MSECKPDPLPAPAAPEAHLGIFWMVPERAAGVLVADSVPVSAAEHYGDCLTYPHGHYEIWTRWQRLGSRELVARGLPVAIMSYEYDAVPRGRIVFECTERRFVIYADRMLFAAPTTVRIVQRFGLAQKSWLLRADAHYRT